MRAGNPAIVVHNAAGVIIGWDERAELVFGYAADEMIGRPFAQLIPDEPMPDQAVAECVSITKAGRPLRVICRRSPICDGADGILAVSEVMTVCADEPRAHEPRAQPLSQSPLADGEARFVRLVEELPQLIWTCRPDGACSFVNRCCKAYVALADAACALDWLSIVHPDERERARAAWQTCVAAGTRHRGEYRLRRHDGVYRWFDLCVTPLGSDAQVAEWAFTGSDVDDAHALHDQLRTDRARLNSILATSPGAVISWSVDAENLTEISFISEGSQELYGASPAAIMGDPAFFRTHLHPEDVAQMAATMAESVRTGSIWHGEFRFQHPREGEKWVETHFLPTVEPEGKVIWNGVVLDITARKRSEERLALSQAQLETALEAAQMGAWIWDPELHKVWGNESQRRLWELPDDVPAWYDSAVARSRIHPDDLSWVDEAMARAYATGERLDMEFRVITSSGAQRWMAMRSRAQSESGGRRRRLAGVNLDITKQKLLAENTLRSQKLEALGTLAGGIAHDFNNVLFAISGNAALAIEALDPRNTARAFVQQIADASRRATELVAQILAFSRPQDQKLEVSRLFEAVHEAVRLMRATIPAMIDIECKLDPTTPAVLADASRMVQVIVNLFTNAVHAIGKGRSGLIEVSLTPLHVDESSEVGSVRVPVGDYALLTIGDNGCGMDEQTQARIFDPFFTTKGPGEGTGLGLSVAHGIVKALGGIITVYSQLGRGTSFRLYLPATTQHPSSIRPVNEPRPRGRGQRILFVDDEPVLVTLGTGLLEALGYRAAAFSSPHEALEAFRREPEAFSAAVTDLSMPTMSGFELARALLAIRSDLPVLMMSGYVGPEERATAKQSGVRELVLKPVTMNQLAELLARLH